MIEVWKPVVGFEGLYEVSSLGRVRSLDRYVLNGRHGVLNLIKGRMFCAKDGDFEKAKNQNAMCFAWFEWEKGYTGEPTIKWIA